MSDAVDRPAHYTQGSIECIDATEAAVAGLSGMDAVLTAQVMKYIWRWKNKNGTEDLQKARWYLQRLINAQTFPTAAVTKPDSPTALEKPTPPMPNFSILYGNSRSSSRKSVVAGRPEYSSAIPNRNNL
jgi:Protein of unknwon function (DUF3310)